jgi:hypothetical protein
MQDEPKKEMTLKNGGKITPGLGLSLLGLLENLLEQKPQRFLALVALAQGHSQGVSEGDLAFFRKSLLVRGDGSINTQIRDVLLSGYQQDPGPMMINPFRLESKDQAAELETADDENWQRLAKLIRDEKENEGRQR